VERKTKNICKTVISSKEQNFNKQCGWIWHFHTFSVGFSKIKNTLLGSWKFWQNYILEFCIYWQNSIHFRSSKPISQSNTFSILSIPRASPVFGSCWKSFLINQFGNCVYDLVLFNQDSSESQGSTSGSQGFRRNRPNLPGTKFVTTVLCGCSSIDTWIIA